MARDFDGVDQSLDVVSNLGITDYPMSMGIWFRISGDMAASQALMWYTDVSSTGAYFACYYRGNATGDPISAATRNTTFNDAQTSSSPTQNVWHHALGSYASTSDVRAYIDGGSEGQDTSAQTMPGGIDEFALGYANDDTPSTWLEGQLAEAAVWNIALTAADAAVLATGASPLLVRPDALVGYWPLWGNDSPEIDLIQGNNLTLINAPTKFAHPRIYYPNPKRTFIFPPPSAGGAQFVTANLASVTAAAFAAAGVGSGSAPATTALASAIASAFAAVGVGSGSSALAANFASVTAAAFAAAGLGSGSAPLSANQASAAATAFQASMAATASAPVTTEPASVTATALQASAAGTGSAPLALNLASVTVVAFQVGAVLASGPQAVTTNLATADAVAFQGSAAGTGSANLTTSIATAIAAAFQAASIGTGTAGVTANLASVTVTAFQVGAIAIVFEAVIDRDILVVQEIDLEILIAQEIDRQIDVSAGAQ